MDKDVLVLGDGTEILLEAGAELGRLPVLCQNREEILSQWDKLTEENLSEVAVRNGLGAVVGRYENLVPAAPFLTVSKGADGGFLAIWSLRQKTQVELLTKQVEANTSTLEVHDAAIGDLAEVASALSEKGE